MNPQSDIGLIGLAAMGENLTLNIANHGFSISVFNRTVSKVDDLVDGRAKGKSVFGAHSPEESVRTLKRQRKVVMLIKASEVVDQQIEHLLPLREHGDIIIDGGKTTSQSCSI